MLQQVSGVHSLKLTAIEPACQRQENGLPNLSQQTQLRCIFVRSCQQLCCQCNTRALKIGLRPPRFPPLQALDKMDKAGALGTASDRSKPVSWDGASLQVSLIPVHRSTLT